MSKNHHILIVDDNSTIHEDFEQILCLHNNATSQTKLDSLETEIFNTTPHHASPIELIHYTLDHAFQGEQAIQMVEKAAIQNNPYEVIFMDIRMPPGIDGISTISKIWQKFENIEMVICSAFNDYSWEKIIGIFGLHDNLLFIQKPFNVIEVKQLALSLVRKWALKNENQVIIKNLESIVEERTLKLQELLIEHKNLNEELMRRNALLANLAKLDSLTELLNHGAFHERLNEVLNESRRHHFSVSVIMIDIDNFKNINDTFGHHTGDTIIRSVAQLIKQFVRNYDVVGRLQSKEWESAQKQGTEKTIIAGRYGGDEFVVIAPHCGIDEARIICERLHKGIHSLTNTIHVDIKITASIGAAILLKDSVCGDGKELLRLADEALYTSKKSGRDQYFICLYE